MKEYKKPALTESNIVVEGVYASSGAENSNGMEKMKCSRGRGNCNTGADKCQRCLGGNYVQDTYGKSCPEGMPVKIK